MIEDTDQMVMLFVGEQGIGKSTAVTTLARTRKVAFFDLESGLRARTLRRAGIPLENVVPFKPRTIEGFYAAMTHIEQQGDFGAVIVDSASEVQFRLLQPIKERMPHGKPADIYGLANDQAKAIYRSMRDLGLPMALVALPKRSVDDEGVVFNTNLSPGVDSDVRAMADLVVYLENKDNPHAVEGIDRCGIVRTLGPYRGKDRLALVPGGVMALPTAERFLALYRDELDLETDEATIAMRKRLEQA